METAVKPKDLFATSLIVIRLERDSSRFKKNQTGRYLRSKPAFDCRDEALVEGWLLEAISIEESIITDRLLSIVGTDGDAESCRQSLSSLIAQAMKAMTGSCAPVEGGIFNGFDQWRDTRKECVHAFCKLDDHSYADNSAEIFSEKMWQTANKGRELVDLVKYLSIQVKKGQS